MKLSIIIVNYNVKYFLEQCLHSVQKAIRNIEDAIEGDGIKRPSNSEQKNIDIARKSIFVSNSLDLGHIIQIEDLIMLRPGNGISPMDIEKVLGKKIVQKISHGSKLDWIHFR